MPDRHGPPLYIGRAGRLRDEGVVALKPTESSPATVREFAAARGARYFGPYLGWSFLPEPQASSR